MNGLRLPVDTERGQQGEAGVSLIELLVAIGLLTIVLTALAGTLIASLSAVTRTEQEVIATQLVAEVSESIQQGDFQFVALYEDELTDTVWKDRLDGAGDFEGQELVTVAGPTATRDDRYPLPVVLETRDGIDFRIDRYLTWVDRDDNGLVETKRLTSIATWTDSTGTERDLRFESERIPTQSEALASDTGTRVIDFRFTPPTVVLDSSGNPTEVVNVFVRTNLDTFGATISYYEYDPGGDTFTLTTDSLTQGTFGANAGFVTWTGTIPASDEELTDVVLADGDIDVLFEATDVDGGPVTALGTFKTTGGPYTDVVTPTPGSTGDPTPTPSPTPSPSPSPSPSPGTPDVAVSITAQPVSICVDATTWALAEPLTFTVQTEGVAKDTSAVTLEYAYYTEQPVNNGGQVQQNQGPDATANTSMFYVSGDATSAVYEVTIPDAAVLFNPDSNQHDDVEFLIEATRGDGAGPNFDSTTTTRAVVGTPCP